MQRTLHERFSGPFVKIILGVIGVVFGGFFGIQGYFGTRVDSFVAKVNGEEISQQQFRERLEQERRMMQAQYGQQIDMRTFETPEFKRSVLERMVDEQLIRDTNGKLGASLPPQRVYEQIAGDPQFQTDGKFDKELYRARIVGSRFGVPAQYEEVVRKDLETRYVPMQIAQSALVTEADVDTYLRLRDQTRDFRDLKLDKPSAADIKIADADIEAYYKDHSGEYTTPEKVSLDYVEVDASKLQLDAKADDAALKQRYEEQKNRFVAPEQRLTSHILVSVDKNADAAAQKTALEKAQKIAQEVKSGKDFAAVAKAQSDDVGSKAQGGDLGWLKKGDTDAAFDAALFGLKNGEISEPVKSAEGYHIIQLRDIKPEKTRAFDEVKSELAKQYLEGERERKYSDISQRLTDLIYQDPSSLEPAAKELGLKIEKTGLFARTGGEGIAANPAVVNAAFSNAVLTEGNTSDPIELGPNHLAVIHLDQHEKAVPKPLEQVRDAIRKKLTDEQLAKQAGERADALYARIEKGETLEHVADELKLKVETQKDVGRNAANLDRQLVAAVFKLPRPTADKPSTAKVPLAGDSYALVALDTVKDGDPSKLDAKTREAARNQLRQGLSTEAVRGYIDSLRKAAKIEIAEDRM